MGHDSARFIRLPRASAGGAKLTSRGAVNPRLTPREAADAGCFLAALRRRLGEPDHCGDSDFSYSVRDTQVGFDFEAYSAQSGPAYGGDPPDAFVDFAGNDNRTRPELLRALADFERWLDEAP